MFRSFIAFARFEIYTFWFEYFTLLGLSQLYLWCCRLPGASLIFSNSRQAWEYSNYYTI